MVVNICMSTENDVGYPQGIKNDLRWGKNRVCHSQDA